MDTGPPPPGGDVDRNTTLTGVSWALASLATIFVTLRIYCRVFVTRNMWWDDWAIILTMIWSLTFTILWVVYANVGGTRHVYYLPLPTIESALKINWISQVFCVLGLAFGKISVGFLIIRIGVPNIRTRSLLYFFMVSQFIMFSLAIIFVFAQCTPVTKLWEVEAPGKCWNTQILTIWTIICSSYSAFLDIALAAIPVSVIWTLQMPMDKKVSLSLILSVGIFAAICGAIKTSKLPSESARSDFTWNTVPLFIWNSVEVNVVIMAACVPAMRPLYLILFRRPGAEHYGGSSRQKRSYQMHPSSHDNPRRGNKGPHNDLMSSDTAWNATTLRGTDGDGEGLVKQGNGTIRQTVEMDVRFDSERGSPDFGEGGESRRAQKGW